MASKTLMIALLAALPLASMAGETVGELGQVQAKTFVLRAQNALAEEQRRQEKVTGGPARASAGAAAYPDLPVVARVVGQSSAPIAYLLYADGSVVPARQGVRLRGGYVVSTIKASRVEVSRGREVTTLGFSVYAPRLPKPEASTDSTLQPVTFLNPPPPGPSPR